MVLQTTYLPSSAYLANFIGLFLLATKYEIFHWLNWSRDCFNLAGKLKNNEMFLTFLRKMSQNGHILNNSSAAHAATVNHIY